MVRGEAKRHSRLQKLLDKEQVSDLSVTEDSEGDHESSESESCASICESDDCQPPRKKAKKELFDPLQFFNDKDLDDSFEGFEKLDAFM